MKKNNETIDICCVEDPENKKVWSATPANIIGELKRRGYLGNIYNSDILTWRVSRVLNMLSRIYYGQRHNLARGVFCRYAKAAKVSYMSRGGQRHNILHMGSLDMPSFLNPKHNHYIVCDSTWYTWSKYALDQEENGKRLMRDAERLEKRSYQQAKHIFSISEYVKSHVVEHYGIPEDRVTSIGTGRGSITAYDGKKDFGNGRILFVAKGRFKDKGGPLVIDAFSKARQKLPHLELDIVGQHEYREKLSKIPGVRAHGFLPLEELQLLFEDASLFVMPAENEPWGLVYLEALSCGTPILGLNKGAFPELCNYGEFGYIVEESSPQLLAELLLNAFGNPKEMEAKGRAGREYCIREFTWQNCVSKITNVIQREVNSG